MPCGHDFNISAHHINWILRKTSGLLQYQENAKVSERENIEINNDFSAVLRIIGALIA